MPSKAIEGSAYTIAGINKNQNNYKTIVPAPNAYNPRILGGNDGPSIGLKLGDNLFNAKRASMQPGPGNYDPLPPLKNHGNAKFGSDARRGVYNEKLAKLGPGPNMYNSNARVIQRSDPKFSFGTSRRPHSAKGAKGIPGPGAY